MNHDPQGDTDMSTSSAQTKLARRRAEQMVWGAVAAFFLLPTIIYILVVNFGAVDGTFGLLGTLFIGLFSFLFPILITLLVLTGIGYAIYSNYRRPASAKPLAKPPTDKPGHVARPPTNVVPAAVYSALEELRAETLDVTRRRKRLFVLSGIGLAVLLFCAMVLAGGRWRTSPGVIFLTMLALGAAGGWFLAVSKPRKIFSRSFKEALMPALLARYGELTHMQNGALAIDRLVETGILPPHREAKIDDTITGTCHGRQVTICELTLKARVDRGWVIVFRGLIVEVSASPPFGSTTVLRDSETEAGTPEREGRPLAPVSFNDAAFEEIYSVYGSDEARTQAMMTPTVRNSLLTMADGTGFHPPLILCEGDKIIAALQSVDWRDLFEPPDLFARQAEMQVAMMEAELAQTFAIVGSLLAILAPPA